MKKKKIISVLLATAVAGSMVSVTAGCNVGEELKETTVYFVGDSTVCEFGPNEDANLYMKRYGYGTQFANYISDKVTVKNLAMSGRSSYSYTQEDKSKNENHYTTLKENIKAGDYLIIGFGHNDQTSSTDTHDKLIPKYTDPTRGKDDDTSITTLFQSTEIPAESVESRPVSFKYVLNKYYIKLAKEVGATPILCTPIVRLTEKAKGYTGAKIHVTDDLKVGDVTYKGGDYAKAIRDLGKEASVTVVDLTARTLADYNTKNGAVGVNNYDEVKWRHSIKDAEWADSEHTKITEQGVDKTHTNKFGAQMNAYYLADALKSSKCSLGKYVKSGISKPVFNELNVRNEHYLIRTPGQFEPSLLWGVSAPWYGTAFGATGGTKFTSNFLVEQYAEENTFKVGGLNSGKGKISKNEEGFAAAFYQLNKDDKFEITAEVTLDTYTGNDQTGFGIMLRDNIVIDSDLTGVDEEGISKTISSDYVATGAYSSDGGDQTNIIFSRGDKTSDDKEHVISSTGYQVSDLKGGELVQGSTHTLKIERLGGNKVTVYFDDCSAPYELGSGINLFDIDASHMYLCLFATRGTTATFKLTDFKVNDQSKLN